jgi:hypothetical protein
MIFCNLDEDLLILAVENLTIEKDCTGLISPIQDHYIRKAWTIGLYQETKKKNSANTLSRKLYVFFPF